MRLVPACSNTCRGRTCLEWFNVGSFTCSELNSFWCPCDGCCAADPPPPPLPPAPPPAPPMDALVKVAVGLVLALSLLIVIPLRWALRRLRNGKGTARVASSDASCELNSLTDSSGEAAAGSPNGTVAGSGPGRCRANSDERRRAGTYNL